MLGGHLVKSWSSTQKNAISLSSGEAELYAAVKGVGTGLGLRQYMADLGIGAVELRVHTDSSAAQGICKRVGLGTQRHIAVHSLWVQEKLRRKEFLLFKVKGEDNPADLMTKHLPRDKMLRCLHFMGCEYREGRPKAAPYRKDYEQIVGEDMDWQCEEAARAELDDEAVELRLASECLGDVHPTQSRLEEIMVLATDGGSSTDDARTDHDEIYLSFKEQLWSACDCVQLRENQQLDNQQLYTIPQLAITQRH